MIGRKMPSSLAPARIMLRCKVRWALFVLAALAAAPASAVRSGDPDVTLTVRMYEDGRSFASSASRHGDSAGASRS
jgi:hypothetical protein